MDGRDATGKILPSLSWNHKASSLDHIPPLLLLWELLDALNQVLVTRSVACDKLSNQWDCAEAPPLVNLVEQRICDTTELQAGKDTTWLENAVCLSQCLVLVGEVPDSKCDSVQIDRVIWDWQFLSICYQPVQVLGASIWCFKTAFPALGQHIWIDVGDCDAGVWGVVDVVSVVEHAESNVAGTTGNIEDVPSLCWCWAGGMGERVGVRTWVEGAHEMILPEAVDS